MRVPVAAVQFEPQFGDKTHNLTELLRLTREAARAGARLVVLPEMATTGYCFRSRAEIAPLVEPVPGGPTVTQFAQLAAALGIYVVVGLPEVEPSTGAFYNTAAFVGPEGYIGKYRKTHSFIDETRWARDGDLGVPVFQTAVGRVAMLICMDNAYFEPARLAALGGAELIAFPTNWLGNQNAWRARALENGVYIVAANRWGEERGARFCGRSVILDPSGRELQLQETGNGFICAEIDTDMARAASALALVRRQPEQYQELLVSSYLWHWQEAHRLPAGRPVVVAAGTATTPERMADQARWADKRARDRGWPKLDLAVFPWCETVPDVAALAELAQTLDAHLVWAAAETGACVVGPEGVVAAQREASTLDLPWGRLGLLTDGDLLLPETARILAKRGADIIAAPVRWAGEQDPICWAERCMENDTPVAVAPPVGGGIIYQPMRPRTTLAEVPGEMTLALVDTSAEPIRAKELLRKLQPRWYEPLVKP